MSKTINVMEYGAVGDGVTDDHAAIQNAILAAQDGDTIFFPATDKLYKISRTLKLDSKKVNILFFSA